MGPAFASRQVGRNSTRLLGEVPPSPYVLARKGSGLRRRMRRRRLRRKNPEIPPIDRRQRCH